ncbi:hypothetical protein V5O48_008983, partial [Marasmius crinis-equi]
VGIMFSTEVHQQCSVIPAMSRAITNPEAKPYSACSETISNAMVSFFIFFSTAGAAFYVLRTTRQGLGGVLDTCNVAQFDGVEEQCQVVPAHLEAASHVSV